MLEVGREISVAGIDVRRDQSRANALSLYSACYDYADSLTRW